MTSLLSLGFFMLVRSTFHLGFHLCPCVPDRIGILIKIISEIRQSGGAPTWKGGILRDPGAVSWAGRKGAKKVFKHRRKSPWVPTLTGPFPNGQANAGSWLGTKNALYFCAQSANSSSWVLFVSSYTTAIDSIRLVWLMHQRNARSQETLGRLLKRSLTWTAV